MNTGLRIHGVVCLDARIVDRQRFDNQPYVQVQLADGRTYWYKASEVIRYAYHPSLSYADRHAELLQKFGGRGR